MLIKQEQDLKERINKKEGEITEKVAQITETEIRALQRKTELLFFQDGLECTHDIEVPDAGLIPSMEQNFSQAEKRDRLCVLTFNSQE
eukprot:m.174307 g.174307  ORF g.174307 m.174307 type:complete len:88 (+) comp39111_c0_seq12:1497-1760(+)